VAHALVALTAVGSVAVGCVSASDRAPTAVGSTDPPAGAAAGTVAPAPPTEWPTHGYDLADTRATPASETTISTADVGALAPGWVTPNLKGMSAAPIVAGGVVYFGDWTGTVRALDAGTGATRWATDLHTYYIGGSVAVDDDRVYVGTFDAKVVALDRRSGAVVWTTPVDDGPGSAVFASPVVADGLVITGVASFEEFTDPKGSKFRGHVVGLDTTTGREVWRYWTTHDDATSGPGIGIWSAVSVDTERHLVYVPTGNNYLPPSGPTSDAIVALDDRTGAQVWVTRFTTGDIWTLGGDNDGPDADVGAPPNLFDLNGRPALGVGDKAGVFHALDRTTGAVLWTHPLTKGGSQGGVMQSGAYGAGRLYVASNKAGTTADLVSLDAADGHEHWRVDVGGHSTAPVTLSNGVVYVTDDLGHVSSFDAADGHRLSTLTVPAPAAGGVVIAEGTLFVGFGWWLASAPADPQGGLATYRLPGAAGPAGGGAGGPGTTTLAVPGVDPASGAGIYARSCASCHGGDGSGGFGPSLRGVADRYTREQHLDLVHHGRDKMPSWDGVLTDDEIAKVVDYERATFR
jgi:polyvinyl alcohol dehydrogenase (cytochrome)